MKIIKTDSLVSIEHNQKQEDIMSSALNHIFLICKEDKEFQNKVNVNDLDLAIEELKLKISKQDDLAKKSLATKEKITSGISSLDENNNETRSQLLESLGSEL